MSVQKGYGWGLDIFDDVYSVKWSLTRDGIERRSVQLKQILENVGGEDGQVVLDPNQQRNGGEAVACFKAWFSDLLLILEHARYLKD